VSLNIDIIGLVSGFSNYRCELFWCCFHITIYFLCRLKNQLLPIGILFGSFGSAPSRRPVIGGQKMDSKIIIFTKNHILSKTYFV
jgi:hypothetical protein